MNNVILVGRFTRDPDIRYTESGLSIARFSLAVDRRFKSEEGPAADLSLIHILSDELKRKVSEFQMLLKTKALSAENTDSEKNQS